MVKPDYVTSKQLLWVRKNMTSRILCSKPRLGALYAGIYSFTSPGEKE